MKQALDGSTREVGRVRVMIQMKGASLSLSISAKQEGCWMQADNFNALVYLYGNPLHCFWVTCDWKHSVFQAQNFKDEKGCLLLDERTMMTENWH